MKMLRKLATRLGVAFVFMAITSLVWAQSPKVVVIPLGGDEAPTFKTMFVTPDTYTGDLKDETKEDLDGPSGADRRCMEFAEATDSKVKGKVFKAWLSTGFPATFNGSHRKFVIHNLPYHNVNGEVIFDDLWNLDVVPSHLILDQKGLMGQTFAQTHLWTGIFPDGSTGTGKDCDRWEDPTASSSGVSGSISRFVTLLGAWTSYSLAQCWNQLAILCVEQ
jgi:hypothetical protein